MKQWLHAVRSVQQYGAWLPALFLFSFFVHIYKNENLQFRKPRNFERVAVLF
jgi:hypothetical protein